MENFMKWLDEHEAALKELYAALESAAALTPNVVNTMHQLFGHVAAAKADASPALVEPKAPAEAPEPAVENLSAASVDTAA